MHPAETGLLIPSLVVIGVSVALLPHCPLPIFSTTSQQIPRRSFTPGPSLASATPISVRLFDTRVNICYRIVNPWDVVPHLPPVLALYEHEGSSLHIDSGLTFDVVHNHLLITGLRTRHRRLERAPSGPRRPTHGKDSLI